MPQAPASRAARTTAASCSGRSEMPGQDRRHPDRGADAGVDELLERAQPLARRRRARLGPPPDLAVERRHRERDRDLGALRGASASTSRSRTIIGPRVIIAERVRAPRRAPRGRRGSAGSGPRPAGRGRWRRRSRSPRRATRAARARARSTSAMFDLDPDRGAVAAVGGPVGAQLEGPDVTERAAVDAAHVRVERPAERHPARRGSARPCTAPRGTRPALRGV